MADDGPARWRTAQAGLSFIQTIGGKLEQAAGTVAHAAQVAATAVKDNIIDGGEFDRIRSFQQELARQGRPQKARHYSEAEWEEAERKADEVLSQFYPGYFTQDFDPVKHELEQLTSEAGQEEIDAIVDRLTTGVEKATGKLSRHVFRKREQLLTGINNVASVEDDLKAAFMITRSSRASLKQSGEEIMRNMRVVGQTRRKQHYMELLEVCSKVQRARTLQLSLKRAQEMGEYGEAILLCVQCFEGVDSMKQLRVWGELRETTQRHYVETLGRVDGALTAICAEFDPARYSKVLEAYMLQGIQGKHLAEKVLHSFREAICDVTMKVVRSLLLTDPKVVEKLAAAGGGSAMEGGYAELCARLPPDLLRPCLLRLLEVLYDVMASYHVMAQWHREVVAQQPEQQPEQQPAQQLAQDAEAAEVVEAAADASPSAITGFLTCVGQVLCESRVEVFELACQRAAELLNMPALYKGEDFVQVVEWGYKFLAAGEAFTGAPASATRALLDENCARFFDSFHRGNMESLSLLLQNEVWKDASIPPGQPASIHLGQAVSLSPLYTPGFGEDGALPRFDDWLLQEGNPFTRGAKSTRKQQAMKDILQGKASPLCSRMQSELNLAAAADRNGNGNGNNGGDASPSDGGDDGERPDHGDGVGGGGSGRPLAPWGAHPSAPALGGSAGGGSVGGGVGGVGGTPGRGGAWEVESEADSAGPSASSTPARGGAGAGAGGRALTASAAAALKFIRAYGQLIKPMRSRCPAIFHAITEVFDNYLLSCFILFSGITLQGLVIQENLLPTRLKDAIMRILTAPSSRFRYAVEELKRMQALQGRPSAAASSGMSFLDRFTNKVESLATELERSVAGVGQRINSTVSSIQMPAAISAIAGELARAVERVEALSAQHGEASAGLYGLHERIAATDSLLHMADQLKEGKAALVACLPPATAREAEAYFSPRGTVEAARDLRDTLFRGAARKLLAEVLDEDRGTAQQIATTSYALREPLSTPSVWVEHAVRCYTHFAELISRADLPFSAVLQVWDHAVSTGGKAIVDGLSRIKRCTFEGRASMSYDLSHVSRAVRSLAPKGVSSSFRTADAYIKAFYLPWEELDRFCQVHLAVYGKRTLASLVELMADAYRIKRAQKNDMLDRIDAFAKEFAQA